jgi:putative lipoprotein
LRCNQAAHPRGHTNLAILLGLSLCALIVTGCLPSVDALQSTQPAPPTGPATPPPSATVKGTVACPEFVTFAPTSAVVTIQLVDISAGDAAAVVLGEQIIEPAGRPIPFEFEIDYDPASIAPDGVYAVEANIMVDGRLLYETKTTHPVITQGHPATVEAVLTRVGPWSPFDLALSSGRLARFSH